MVQFGEWSALRSLLSFAPVSLDFKHLDKPARFLPSCDNAVGFHKLFRRVLL